MIAEKRNRYVPAALKFADVVLFVGCTKVTAPGPLIFSHFTVEVASGASFNVMLPVKFAVLALTCWSLPALIIKLGIFVTGLLKPRKYFLKKAKRPCQYSIQGVSCPLSRLLKMTVEP